MVYDILHGHENTCPYCWERYEAMGHGLQLTYALILIIGGYAGIWLRA
jgi:hypothetical protein